LSILTRPLLFPQERYDLEDFNLALSALRSDSQYYTKGFIAPTSYILAGFVIPQSTIGQTSASIILTNSVLINGNSPSDFSWWAAPVGASPLAIPVGNNGLQPGRNYVSLEIYAQNGTPLQRAFWDPTANSGAGSEFSQSVNTVTELFTKAVVSQSGFDGGNTALIPLAIIDLNNSNVIVGIQDQRNLLFRLGSPDDSTGSFAWNTRIEPAVTLTFTGIASGTFLAGETVSFTSGATAIVQTGGTNNITVYNFSNPDFLPGDVVLGATSNASAALFTYYEAFSGADKDITTYQSMFSALMTEIKGLKGTPYWYQTGPVVSVLSLLNLVNTITTPISSGAKYMWDGTSLYITDNKTTGQTLADVIGAVRVPGLGSNIYMTRQDGTGGSAPLGIADGSVLFVQLPAAGSDRTFSESGSGVTNYQVVPRASFVPTDSNYILAYREGSILTVTGIGDLSSGETSPIGNPISRQLLAFIGSPSETSTNPPYTTTPSVSLSNQFTNNDSLTQAISINAANINDIVSGLLTSYDEAYTIISGSTSGNNLHGPITSSTNITIPLDSRNASVQKQYLVNSGCLLVILNGQALRLGADYTEVGTSGTLSSQIQILQTLVVGDLLEFRLFNPQIFGTAANNQPWFVNYITGQNGTDIPVGHLYNMATGRLAVYRNGLASVNSLSVGSAIDQYQEATANSITLSQAANTSEVFQFVNWTTPNPSIVYMTGQIGTTLTIPTYTIGNGTLQIYRNGVLLSTNGSAPADLKYTESTTTSVTLALAAQTSDVFEIYIAGTVPAWRIATTGITGTTVTIPTYTYTLGDNHLLVFRNGVLMVNSTVIGDITSQYQQASTNTITLQVAAVSTDLFEFIYV
jgi:hypothetical protein